MVMNTFLGDESFSFFRERLDGKGVNVCIITFFVALVLMFH